MLAFETRRPNQDLVEYSAITETTRESDLIELAKLGDLHAWECLVNQNVHRLRCSLCRPGLCPALADDIVQETFMRALDNLEKFRCESGFFTWLFRIALNLRSSYLRKPSYQNVSLEGIYDRVAKTVDPAEELIRLEQYLLIRNLMQKLNPIHRQVLRMKYYESLDYRKIAELLNIEVGTVKSRVHRAKDAMREQLVRTFEEDSLAR